MPTRSYTQITDGEVPADAVAVSIGGETDDELTVSILWPERGPGVPADEEEGGKPEATQQCRGYSAASVP